jgi:hypothetical protein
LNLHPLEAVDLDRAKDSATLLSHETNEDSLLRATTPPRPDLTQRHHDLAAFSVKTTSMGDDTSRKLQAQTTDIQNAAESIIAEISKKQVISQDSALIQEVENLKQSISKLHGTSEALTAKVILPEPEDMTVRLISTSSFERLEEYHGDESLAWVVFGLAGGGASGIYINTITGGVMTGEASAVLILLLIGSGLALARAIQCRWRARQVTRHILSQRAVTTQPREMGDSHNKSLKMD